MTDFVLEMHEKLEYVPTQREVIESFIITKNYANFLKQPLTLGMFVPCDENGNILKEPKLQSELLIVVNDFMDKMKAYNEAKEKVLFDVGIIETYEDIIVFSNGHFIFSKNTCYLKYHERTAITIEDIANDILVQFGLTPFALKAIGINNE